MSQWRISKYRVSKATLFLKHYQFKQVTYIKEICRDEIRIDLTTIAAQVHSNGSYKDFIKVLNSCWKAK